MFNSNSNRLVTATVVIAAALALFASNAFTQQAGDSSQSLTARLQALEDKEAIRSMLEHYIELNESRNWLDYSGLFADDGELVMSSQTLKGPDAIFTTLEENFGADKIGPDSFLYHASHLLTNIQINVDGLNATAISRWSLLVPGENGNPIVYQAGKYRDTLIKVRGEWKFKQRVIKTNLPVP